MFVVVYRDVLMFYPFLKTFLVGRMREYQLTDIPSLVEVGMLRQIDSSGNIP